MKRLDEVYSDDRVFRNLIGARLVSADKEGDNIVVRTDKGTLTGTPEGECCSSSWIESVECDAPACALFTGLDLDLDLDASRDREAAACAWAGWSEPDEIDRKVYFGAIYTDRGRITFELRNESNGYYGGYIVWSWSPTTGGGS